MAAQRNNHPVREVHVIEHPDEIDSSSNASPGGGGKPSRRISTLVDMGEGDEHDSEDGEDKAETETQRWIAEARRASQRVPRAAGEGAAASCSASDADAAAARDVRSWALEEAMKQHKQISGFAVDDDGGGDGGNDDSDDDEASAEASVASSLGVVGIGGGGGGGGSLAGSQSVPALLGISSDSASMSSIAGGGISVGYGISSDSASMSSIVGGGSSVGYGDGSSVSGGGSVVNDAQRAALRSSKAAKTRDGRVLYSHMYSEVTQRGDVRRWSARKAPIFRRSIPRLTALACSRGAGSF